MESQLRAHSVQTRGREAISQPASSTPLNKSRTTKLLSTFRGIIRFPRRKHKDGCDFKGSSECSTSWTGNSPSSRNAAIGDALTKPQANGENMDGLHPEDEQLHAISLVDDTLTASAAIHGYPFPAKDPVQHSQLPSREISNIEGEVNSAQKQLTQNPLGSIRSSLSPEPDHRSLFKPCTPTFSAANSSTATQMSPDDDMDNTAVPKSSFTTSKPLQPSGFGQASTPGTLLVLPSNQRFGSLMNEATRSSAHLSPSIVLRPPPLPLLNLPTLPPLTPTTTLAKEGSQQRQLKNMPSLPLQEVNQETRGCEKLDDEKNDDWEEGDETAEASVEEDNLIWRSGVDKKASGSGPLDEFASRHPSSRPHFRGLSYDTSGDFSSSSRDGETFIVRRNLPKVDTSQLDMLSLERSSILTGPMNGKGKGKARDDSCSYKLRRRRSMPMFTETSPPSYPAFPLTGAPSIMPREDEGREKLPPYSNAIYLKAIMLRKLEFSAPGVQAKDRKWHRVMCVLVGTAFNVYKANVVTMPLWRTSSPVQHDARSISPTLHSQIGSGQNSARNLLLIGNNQYDIVEPNAADLIKRYTLQNAGSERQYDYLKKKNVIRVHMEGEQFLLQTEDAASVVRWLEALQAATNIASDLDERPIPPDPSVLEDRDEEEEEDKFKQVQGGWEI